MLGLRIFLLFLSIIKKLLSMEGEKSIQIIGKRSPLDSAFAIFENFSDWVNLRKSKVLPDGVYFAVVLLGNKNKADIYPHIFVQGYRPHSSGAQIHVDKRRYGKFVLRGAKVAPDDVEFDTVQLYQIKGERAVELILTEGECQTLGGARKLIDRICQDRQLEQLSKVKHYLYDCPTSVGYFLKGRIYDVWSVLIGENTGFALEKKVLIVDYLTGIPAIVPYEDACFAKAE